MSVPKLRFKEFDEAWKPSILADISNIVTGSTPATSKSEYYDGDFLFVSPADIQENRYVDATKTTLTKEGFNKCRHIPKNSILFVCIGSTIGKIAQNKEICATNQQINAVIPNNDHVSDFLYLVLDKLAPSIKLTAGVQAVPLINKTEFGKTELFTPTLGEQTKIASFLSAVDEKINQLTQKHELLSQYKQGMMQKLFSQQIRFKADDGSEFGEWEELKFKDVIKIKYGKDHKKLEDGDIPVLGTGGIMRYVDSYLYDGESILIGRKGTIDKPQFISGKFWTVDTLFYTEIGEKIQPKFAFQQLLLVNWLNLNEATGVPSLNTTSIGNIELKVPNLKEQTKIANFLSAIDQKIEVVAQQIEQAKTWKKGLLQQMFV
ncbi:restriction endonuclease subunit S [Acinetobacter faecalis]|uniref:restriction endonuclease subunit S n=1 Tax=Acinetobacter faecalis TaxID=2665161 RepID=UPI002A90B0D5|nr:restriction endonuclease subunit S [Acinetobacter faecalis]MDY6489654.1 restriction endonuclease subunit S [Acinetobacter faecalis]